MAVAAYAHHAQRLVENPLPDTGRAEVRVLEHPRREPPAHDEPLERQVVRDEDNPVRIRGRLELLRENRDGLFYKMTGATMVQ